MLTPWKFGVSCAILAMISAPQAARADDLDSIEKKLTELTRKTTSMRMKMRTMTDVSMEGYEMKGESSGSWEWLREGDKVFFRSETKMQTATKFSGQEQRSESTATSVSDGEHMYTLSDTDGQKMCTKMKQNSGEAIPWNENPLEALKKDYNLKLLPDEAVGGADCYVIEARPKDEASAAMAPRTVYWFRKSDAIMPRMVSYSPDGKPSMTMEVTDVEVNPTLDKASFTFTPPPGVQVVEMPAAAPTETENP